MTLKIVLSVLGLLLGIPCGATVGYFIDCAVFGSGAHMEICGIAGIVYGAGPGGVVGGIAGWLLGAAVKRRAAASGSQSAAGRSRD